LTVLAVSVAGWRSGRLFRTANPGTEFAEDDVLKFKSAEEQAAWTMAEALSEKGFSCMKQAEEAAEIFRAGKMQMRRNFKARGMSEVDADIRWSGTATARKALSDNDWYMAQASMYNEAATAQYAKALYLKNGE
jgi:hypothetical protein